MPIISVPPLYNPQLFSTEADHRQYRVALERQQALGAEYERRKARFNNDFQEIIARFIAAFEHDAGISTRIFATGDPVFPLQLLIARLREPIKSPERAISLIIGCQDRFRGNSLASGVEDDAYTPIVEMANATGERLMRAFAPFIAELRALNLSSLEEEMAAIDRQMASLDIKTVALRKLNDAFIDALEAIQGDADSSTARDASQVRYICRIFIDFAQKGEYSKITEAKLNSTIYSTDAYVSTQRAKIKSIMEAHLSNLRTVQLPTFELPVAPAAAPAIAVTAAGAAAALSPASRLKSLLDVYLEQRSAKTDANKQTKTYLHGRLFACFQFSFSQKEAAVTALKHALDGEPTDLLPHLATLRNGNLGKTLRAFIKEGHADAMVGHEVRTVRDFVYGLNERLLSSAKPK